MAATGQNPPSRDACDGLHQALEGFDAARAGEELHSLVRELYPICRSITGEGLRRSLRILSRVAPLEVREVPSGTKVFDWVVPPEWTLRAARLVGPGGEVVCDAARSSLEVLNYSAPFRGRVSRRDLEAHLHSIPEQPSLVPYRTSYYRPDWGFCLPHARRTALAEGEYQVLVDSTLADGSMSYGELVVPGAETGEVVVSAHCCHPSLANDNCSGMAISATLARLLSGLEPRYTYRFLFVPGTIGTIAWLALHEEEARRIEHGLVLACLGDPGRMNYKRTRRGDAEIDRVVSHVLAASGQDYRVRDFTPYGYDERQYGSPGFNLAVGALTRTPHGEYAEYHTSADDPSFVRPDRLADSLRRCLEILLVLEGNRVYLNLLPKCEPQLGKRGLYGSVGGSSHAAARQMAMLWLLNLADGSHSLLDVAERSRVSFGDLREAARALEAAGLLRVAGREEARP